MGEDRLNGLALPHIHKDHRLISQLDPLKVFKESDAPLHRRIAQALNLTTQQAHLKTKAA